MSQLLQFLQLLVHGLGKGGEDGPWVRVPVTLMGDQDEAPVSCFQSGTVMDAAAILGINQQNEDLPLSLLFPLSSCNSVLQENKS